METPSSQTPHSPKEGNYDTEKKNTKAPHKILCVASVAAIAIGSILMIAGIVFISWFNSGSSGFVSTNLVNLNVVKDSKVQDFVNAANASGAVPKYKTVYVLNVNNPKGIRQGQKADITEKGPYNYQQFDMGLNATLNEDGTEVSFYSYSTFEYKTEGSCEGCTNNDQISSWNPGYLAVMTGAFQESNFAKLLLSGLGIKDLQATYSGLGAGISAIVPFTRFVELAMSFALGTVNCLDSFDAKATVTCVSNLKTLLTALQSGAVDVTSLTPILTSPATTGAYPGVFVNRTVDQWVYGFPSFIAGIATTSSFATNYTYNTSDTQSLLLGPSGCGVSKWQALCGAPNAAGVFSKCDASIPSMFCNKYCTSCASAAAVVKLTENRFCPYFQNLLVSQGLDAAVAQSVVDGTCKRCSAENAAKGTFFPFCLAPLPGILDSNDYKTFSMEALQASVIAEGITTQNTGKVDKEKILYYGKYKGASSKGVWANNILGKNPSPFEIFNHSATGAVKLCNSAETKPQAASLNVTCVDIVGGSGTAYPASGASTKGLSSENYNDTYTVYISQANVPVGIFYTGKTVDVKGISLSRYAPSKGLLNQTAETIRWGVGYPTNGVINLGYAKGFLVYVSYPYYLYGNSTLLDAVSITKGGAKLTSANVASFEDDLSTYLDIEPASGTTMRAHKRLMASMAVNSGLTAPTQLDISFMTGMNSTQPFVITPVYWVDENAEITDSKANTFNTIESLAKATIPVTATAIIVGAAFAVGGFIFFMKYRAARRAFVASTTY